MGGPLVEDGARCWLSLPVHSLPDAAGRLAALGYTERVEAITQSSLANARQDPADHLRWKGDWYRRHLLHVDDPNGLRNAAPDRRIFLLPDSDGLPRPVKGYRGTGRATEKRGLSVPDARAVANLARKGPARGCFLDPFAGVGGIAIEARRVGWHVATVDNDPVLRFGLQALSDVHVVGDARQLPFHYGSFDAIATEPPYDLATGALIEVAVAEMSRVLVRGGRLSMLLPEWQAGIVRELAGGLGLSRSFEDSVDRKGMDVVLLAFQAG
jgi:SAM-dependent methyltransferase